MSNRQELFATKGSVRAFPLAIKDNLGQPEDISWATRAEVTVRESELTAPVLTLDSSAGTLQIDVSNSRVTPIFSQAAADALIPGTYLVIVSLQKTNGEWEDTEPFWGVIAPALATH